MRCANFSCDRIDAAGNCKCYRSADDSLRMPGFDINVSLTPQLRREILELNKAVKDRDEKIKDRDEKIKDLEDGVERLVKASNLIDRLEI